VAAAITESELSLVCVGTPSQTNGDLDLTYIRRVNEQIGAVLANKNDRHAVVIRSTILPGTMRHVVIPALEQCSGKQAGAAFDVCNNPEFLREGAAIDDFKHPDRVVVGTDDERARTVMYDIYRPLFLNETPIVFTSRRTSELIKYAANAFLAMKITFINEMAELCEAVGANVQEVARGVGLDNRIGGKFLHAGPGYGGSCFPKDTLALTRTAQEAGAPLRLIETVVDVNDARKRAMASKIIKACGGDVAGKTVAILGLTFKPNTDDMRDAPSLEIIPALQKAGARVKAFDPAGTLEAEKLLSNVEFVSGPYFCAEDADVLAIITEWNEFRALDLERIKSVMRTPTIVDLRNIYSPEEMAAAGFAYSSVGRPAG